MNLRAVLHAPFNSTRMSWDSLGKTILQHPLEGFKGSRNDNSSDIFVLSYFLLHGIPSVKFIPVYTCVLYIKC